jgi:hypothetical protein
MATDEKKTVAPPPRVKKSVAPKVNTPDTIVPPPAVAPTVSRAKPALNPGGDWPFPTGLRP